ncbi:unnamed protein product [Rotaria magnacalcarata]|uniref:AB hydrolase-1 domain-containing protein n=1 Tax=Rotaria magnacalcarata TaxID=392030 RepID=A0A820CHY5_9BILA|nr:unnamed protein product [Rotaria magnacalcarata]
MMSSNPTSHFVIIPNRPVVQEDGDIKQDRLKLHYWEWKGRQPTILFCHAASFHGRCYDRIINEALSGFHVIALDFRGHGRSQTHPPPYRFRWFGEDVLEFTETLNLSKNNLIGIGHSLVGYALTWAAAAASKQLFQSLLLLDPVILSPAMYQESENYSLISEFILQRRSQWSSIEDMMSRLEKRETFSQWPKDVLRNYCTYAVDENHKLVCAPDGEASIYQSSNQPDSDIYALIEKSKYISHITIHIVRSSTTILSWNALDISPTEPELVKWFKTGRDTHFAAGDYAIVLIARKESSLQPAQEKSEQQDHTVSIIDLTPEVLEVALNTEVIGGLTASQEILPSMIKNGKGTLLFGGATASLRGSANFIGFAAPKVATCALTQSMAREFDPKGIHVAHIIIDGQIYIPTNAQNQPDKPFEAFMNSDAIAETYWQLHLQTRSTGSQEPDHRS